MVKHQKISFGKVELAATMGAAETGGTHERSDAPFHIVVMGDFSGRANRGVRETGDALAKRRIRQVDRDNFDDLLAGFDVRLEQTIADDVGRPTVVSINDLDDFNPDRLLDQLDLFASLRALRRRLQNRDTFAAAAEEVRGWGDAAEARKPETDTPSPTAQQGSTALAEPTASQSGDLLAAALDTTEAAGEVTTGRHDAVNWASLMHDIVAPYSEPGADPQLPELTACVDRAIGRAMSALLHHDDFQQVEGAWRSLQLLTRRLETDVHLKIFMIDLTKEELAADLASEDNLARSGLYRLLVEQTVHTPGSTPWALLLGAYAFGPSLADVAALGRMAKVAHAAGAPFVASSAGAVVGCVDTSQTPDLEDWRLDEESGAIWSELQTLPEADYLAVVWPRFLLRLPYGKKTSPIEAFAFEELAAPSSHESFLWGGGAILAGCLLGQSFSRVGWQLRPGEFNEIGELPVYVAHEDGEAVAQPCGELLLTDRACERVTLHGVMPLISLKESDTVRLPFHGLAGQPLGGRWR